MERRAGFTLVELLVVIAILGVLAGTAIPFLQIWRQRAYGSEATIVMRRLMEAQITYYLGHNSFYPAAGAWILIPRDKPPAAQTVANVQLVEKELNLTLQVGHNLTYYIRNMGGECRVEISAPFPLFKDGSKALYGVVTSAGVMGFSTTIIP